ncbi:MAG TPA: hypothetical protein VMR74_12690 [Gammaproteobacteria bacterium]|nr:hypothetical protein [Gammaproteobacteria bacterium]
MPSPSLSIPRATLSALETEADAAESARGTSQGEIEVNRLATRLEFLEKNIAAANGSPDPALVREAEAAKASLEYQKARNAEPAGNPSNLDPKPGVNWDVQLNGLYEDQFRGAILAECRAQARHGIRLTNKEAAEIVSQRIERDGLDKVLPVFARAAATKAALKS